MSKKRIGVVTIGQTPRPDIEKLVDEILGKDYQLSVIGALDKLKLSDMPSFRDDEYLLMTGMRDDKGGRKGVRVTREFLTPLIQNIISEIEDQVDVIVVWCAGRFPEFKSKVFVVRPCEVLKGVVDAIFSEGKIGVLYPSRLQLIWAEPEWKKEGIKVYADAPGRQYSRDEELNLLADRLAEKKLDLLLLNCTGFGYNMKKVIRERTNIPVIQANALALRVVKELLH
jgi:protein AroM